jgi:magnesium chelatase accessory protein
VTAALDWACDGQTWPHATASRRIMAGGMTWHVQVLGQGPVLLLLHGTGA